MPCLNKSTQRTSLQLKWDRKTREPPPNWGLHCGESLFCAFAKLPLFDKDECAFGGKGGLAVCACVRTRLSLPVFSRETGLERRWCRAFRRRPFGPSRLNNNNYCGDKNGLCLLGIFSTNLEACYIFGLTSVWNQSELNWTEEAFLIVNKGIVCRLELAFEIGIWDCSCEM